MNPSKPENRYFYFDFLRAAAIFAVILLHNSADLVDNYGKIPFTDWAAASVYNGLSRFCVPMFVLLSGGLLLQKGKTITIKELFTKRVSKLVIPLVFWSIIYVLFQNYNQHSFNTLSLTNTLITFYKGPLVFHFWFIYMMLGIYLVYPIFNGFIQVATESQVQYFIVMWFIAMCCFGIIEMITAAPIGFELYGFLGYIGYFVLGYYLKNFIFPARLLKILYTLSIIAFALSVSGTYISGMYHIPHGKNLVESDFTPDIPFAVAGLFLFLKNHSFSDKQQWWKTMTSEVSKESYGIYIVHVLIMQAIIDKVKWLQFENLSTILSIPLKTAVILLLSYGLVRLLKLVPWVRATV